MHFYSLLPQKVSAADGAIPKSLKLTVVPYNFELFSNPGDSQNQELRITNGSNVAQTLQVLVEDFGAEGEEGGVKLIDKQSNNSYSLARWITPEPTRFTVGPGQEKTIKFSVRVPKNAEPGGHYASILVKAASTSGPGGTTGASVDSRVGSLVLLRVAGTVEENARVESFKADKKYYQKSPVDFELRVKNLGNNHIKPQGNIIITNLFGQKVAEIPFEGLNVLPDAIRKMNSEWKPKGLLASRYTASLWLNYGQKNQSLSATTSFIIFPKFLIILIIVIIIVLLAGLKGRKKIKKMIHNLTK